MSGKHRGDGGMREHRKENAVRIYYMIRAPANSKNKSKISGRL